VLWTQVRPWTLWDTRVLGWFNLKPQNPRDGSPTCCSEVREADKGLFLAVAAPLLPAPHTHTMLIASYIVLACLFRTHIH